MKNQHINTALMIAVWVVAMFGVVTCMIANGLCRTEKLARVSLLMNRFNHWVAVQVYMMVQYQRIFAETHTGE